MPRVCLGVWWPRGEGGWEGGGGNRLLPFGYCIAVTVALGTVPPCPPAPQALAACSLPLDRPLTPRDGAVRPLALLPHASAVRHITLHPTFASACLGLFKSARLLPPRVQDAGGGEVAPATWDDYRTTVLAYVQGDSLWLTHDRSESDVRIPQLPAVLLGPQRLRELLGRPRGGAHTGGGGGGAAVGPILSLAGPSTVDSYWYVTGLATDGVAWKAHVDQLESQCVGGGAGQVSGMIGIGNGSLYLSVVLTPIPPFGPMSLAFTPQQLAGGARFDSRVKIGNWAEERSRVEVRPCRILSCV
jgi:hypothetical protein